MNRIDSFVVETDKLETLLDKYPNIVSQIENASSTLQSILEALIYLDVVDGYVPAVVKVVDDGYAITPLIAIHGVGDLTNGDSYLDLRSILDEGFNGSGNVNAYALAPALIDRDILDNFSWAQCSQRDETLGDSYTLEIYKLKLHMDKLWSLPERYDFKEDGIPISVMRADIDDMNLIIAIDLNLPDKQEAEREQYYRTQFKKYIDCGLSMEFVRGSGFIL